MVKIEYWYEKYPELLKREKEILSNYGFKFKIIDNRIEFSGNSRIFKNYPIKLIYPHGYPTFPPDVKCEVEEELLLVRHQSKSTKILCTFGFSNERWRAYFSALEVLEEIEELIFRFNPLNYKEEENEEDVVPEPFVNQFEYGVGQLLIPPPFGELQLEQMPFTSECELLYDFKSGRGIVSRINMNKISNHMRVDKSYESFFKGSPLRKTKIIKLSKVPPFDKEKISNWLIDEGISVIKNKNQILLFVFEDEWGKKGNKRTGWIALKIIDNRLTWIKCYTISSDDIMVRVPYGEQLRNKIVTVVGCGSLGSIVATSLAQEGITNLNLIDRDIMEPSNSIRHQVGQKWFGYSKVETLRQRILELIPSTNVNSYYFSVGSSIFESDYRTLLELIERSDVLIDTTASHKVSNFLNRLCIEENKPLVIGSVTNGAWSCEVVRIIPGSSGCWNCWGMKYGKDTPPSAPIAEYQFAPGCDQPTFIGGISSINIAGGLIVKAGIDTLLNNNDTKDHYIKWSEKDSNGNIDYQISSLPNLSLEDCEVCNGH